MSDVAGLVAAVTVQALLITVLRSSSDDEQSAGVLRVAAFIAGLVIGIRVQTVWLMMPMLICAAAYARLPWRSLAHVALAFLMGVFAWLAPLVIASGGWTQYLGAFASQASDDWRGADILATNLSIEQSVRVFIHTFAYPWTDILLAATVLALALAGFAAMLRRSSTGVMLLALGSAPYATDCSVVSLRTMTKSILRCRFPDRHSPTSSASSRSTSTGHSCPTKSSAVTTGGASASGHTRWSFGRTSRPGRLPDNFRRGGTRSPSVADPSADRDPKT